MRCSSLVLLDHVQTALKPALAPRTRPPHHIPTRSQSPCALHSLHPPPHSSSLLLTPPPPARAARGRERAVVGGSVGAAAADRVRDGLLEDRAHDEAVS
eukprot:2438642-Rhodomonas_salina.1